MSLAGGDLTTPARVWAWLGNTGSAPAQITQMVGSMSAQIFGKLNRARLFSQTFVRYIDGQGTYQLILPDYPVTSVTQVQVGAALITPAPLPNVVNGVVQSTTNSGWGYRNVSWDGNLPGDPTVLEFTGGGVWWPGKQNVKVTYVAGYAELNEAATVPGGGGAYTVLQPQGICCKDIGVTYAATGVALTPVSGAPSTGQYNAPADSAPGTYTFAAGDAGTAILISYSFIPADLEDATIQLVAERQSYTSRIGALSKSLGGQETIRWQRGGNPRQMFPELPPEVEGLIWPYVSVIPPAIGAPV